jgi:hypothetical protein
MQPSFLRSLASLAPTLVLTSCFASCFTESDAPSPDKQWALVQNHFYLERLPENERDMVHQIAFIDHEDAGRIGLRLHASRYRVLIDMFAWQRHGGEVRSTLLQTGQELTSSFRAWRCKGEVKPPFELCLELNEGGETRRYYSHPDWIIEDTADAWAHSSRISSLGF